MSEQFNEDKFQDADSKADTWAALALVMIAVAAVLYHVYTSGL